MLKVRLFTGLLMGTMMSFVMSGFITAVNTGVGPDFLGRWVTTAFPLAWALAVPLAIAVGPWAQGMAERIAAGAAGGGHVRRRVPLQDRGRAFPRGRRSPHRQ